jgi:D-alanyl-D-alanine dipeptidase
MSAFPYILIASLAITVTACRGVRTPMPGPLVMEPVNRRTVVASAAARGLVRVDYFDHSIEIQLPYATADNVFGRVLYPPGFPALLSQPTALKLAMANAKLRKRGLRLLVLDAYRPPEVQWQMYQMFRSDRYVSDPRLRWSKHTYGRAVDVTIIDAEGRPLRMPTAFDDFSEKASARYAGADAQIRANVALLQEVMTRAGFSIYPDEWWHFNDLSNPAAVKGPPLFGRELGLSVATPP